MSRVKIGEKSVKTVVIVGCGKLSICVSEKYASLACKLVFIKPRNTNCEELDKYLSVNKNILALTFDITKESEWRKKTAEIVAEMETIDVLIYLHHFVHQQYFKEVHDMQLIRNIMEINMLAPIYCISSFLPYLKNSSGIVLMNALEDEFSVPYSASQGVSGFMESIKKSDKHLVVLYFYYNASLSDEQNSDILFQGFVNRIDHIGRKDTIISFIRDAPNLHGPIDDNDVIDPPPLKTDSDKTCPLAKAIGGVQRSEIKEILKNAKMSKNNNNAGNIGSIFDDVDEDNRTVLHYTCYIGSIEIFKLITAKIKDKRVLNHQDAFNFTPLHLAAYRGHIIICRKLVKLGADPNILAKGGMSAMHYLCRLDPTFTSMSNSPSFSNSHPPSLQSPSGSNQLKLRSTYEITLKTLIEAGADSNQRNAFWETPIHEAVLNQSLVALTFLHRNEGDIFRKSLRGNETPLHMACRIRNKKLIQYLLENGADPSAPSDGGTCFDITTASICEILDSYREKNRRPQSVDINNQEVIVVNSIQDLPVDAQKIITVSHIDPNELMNNFDNALYILRFLTHRNYVRDAPIIKQRDKTQRALSKVLNPLPLKEATEKYITNGNPRKLFKIIEDAGKGGFGSVFKARKLDDKKIYAIKRVPHLSDKEQYSNFDEVFFLAEVSDLRQVVKYYNSYLSRDEIWMIMEFLEGGTLSEALGRCKFNENHIAFVVKNILKALKEMHKRNYIHRDLKSSNVMLSINAEVKLIDFGLCVDSRLDKELIHMVGSPFWIPPEMIFKQLHSTPADIWSLGIIILEMANGEAPHRSNSFRAMFSLASSTPPTLDHPDKWTKNFRDFVTSILKINPQERPTAEELLAHPFIANMPQNAIADMRELIRHIFLERSLELSLGMA